MMERAVILCQGDVLDEGHIAALAGRAPAVSGPENVPTLEEAERRTILQALERTGGILAGPKGAAELLGINRSTLWSRMQKLGIQVPKSK
jgi:formate hydrogenlyase transcriptional activator